MATRLVTPDDMKTLGPAVAITIADGAIKIVFSPVIEVNAPLEIAGSPDELAGKVMDMLKIDLDEFSAVMAEKVEQAYRGLRRVS